MWRSVVVGLVNVGLELVTLQGLRIQTLLQLDLIDALVCDQLVFSVHLQCTSPQTLLLVLESNHFLVVVQSMRHI